MIVQQVRQRAAEPIQLPDDQHVARAHKRQRGDQAGAIILSARGAVLEQVALVDAGDQQRVAL
jgi:hypothetical protein